MKRSLAEELGGEFEDIDLSLANTLKLTETLNGNHEENMEEIRRLEHRVSKESVRPTVTNRSLSPTVADAGPTSTATLPEDGKQVHTADKSAPSRKPGKTKFVEHSTEPTAMSRKEQVVLMASKHNRELIGRNADGLFNMETMPTVTDVQRRVAQSNGIAALQRTLAPETKLEAAASSNGRSYAPSSTAVDPVKRPSTLRQVTLSKPDGRQRIKIQGPYPYTGRRAQNAPRFSLARDLIAAGHRKKLSPPAAPARFVKLPTDPVVHFKRRFCEFNLKIMIPGSELDGRGGDSGSITSVPDVDSKGDLQFKKREPKPSKEVGPKAQKGPRMLEFGIPRTFIANQCLESSCPMRWAHAKGPYHHKGQRHNRIMTGLFGHSNPPPEIWNAYRNFVKLTWDGEVISPDGRPTSTSDEDPDFLMVIAFATFHYGQLNHMSADDFHRRYAGRHMSSRISLQSSSTNSSKKSCDS